MQREEVRRKWEPYVGKFFLSFTAIEHFVTISIDVLSKKSISNTVRTLLFEKRTEILKELLENNNKVSVHTKSKIRNQVDEAIKLSRNVRNIIAHNHILMELYESPADGEIYEKAYIHSSRNKSKKISLENMIEAARNTEILANRLSESYLDMLKEYWNKKA